MSEPKPEFNAGIDYLETMSLLIKTAHRQSIMKDYDALFNTLLSLQIEIMGRVKSKGLEKYVTRLKPFETNCLMLILNKDKYNPNMMHRKLLKWFEELTIVRHELGLVMPDKSDVWDELSQI